MTLDSHLRVGYEHDFNQEGHQEDDLPDVVQAARLWVLDDEVTLAPVAFALVVLIGILMESILVVVFLEKQLRELFVVVPQFEIGLHVVLIEVLSQDLGVAIDALLFFIL